MSSIESLCLEPQSLAGNGESSPHCFGARMDSFLDYTFPQLFEEQVARGPERPAVVSDNEQLSYAELNSRANQLAHYLRELGVGRETLVGICIDRSLDMAVGTLGILKSGAAYLPLDPDYPAERLTWILKDSRVPLVLTKANLAAQLPASTARLVLLDAEGTHIAQRSDKNPADGAQPNDLAYVIYTSGSTGEPKGVMINHSSLANYVLALQNELDLNQDDRYLHTASIAFSSSRRQLLLPLSRGATVVIASSEQRKDPPALFEMIKQRAVTVMDAVPSFWRNCTAVLASLDGETRAQLLDNRLRLMLSASEPLLSDIPQTWTNQFKHGARHVHMFGQTETAGIVCVYKIPAAEDTEAGVVPVGLPIANTEIYILDDQQQPVAMGTPGELYIGGAGVGRGYLHRPELTAEKFIAHPFSDKEQARLYRTGDWARHRPDGQIEFVGRQDSQVKVRGFRVELGEVEAVLARHGSVKESVVVARDDSVGAKRLVAYFVPLNSAPTVIELRTFLSEQLPDYMVPSTLVQLEKLPLTANGKVNRRALPEPEEQRPELASAYEAPRTRTEEVLAKIWSEVLQLGRIGVNDNFFELGGHSLLAIQVIARINEQFKITVPLRVLFDGPTIHKLAETVDAARLQNSSSSLKLRRIKRDQEIPLSFAQQRLWFIDQLEPGSALYNINRALRLRGPLDVTKLERALQLIANRHEALRTTIVAPEGRPIQVITSSLTVPCQLLDLRLMPAATREQEVQRLIRIETEKPFDLSRGPLLSASLLRLADEEHVLLVSIHHIVSDAWAIKLFFQELASIYRSQGVEVSLPELPIQYADFAHWQRTSLDGELLAPQLAYWKEQLAGAPNALDLPTDHPRLTTPSSRGAQQSISLSESLRQSLKDLGRQEGATLFMILLAAFHVLLARYSGQDDILVGTPVAGRSLFETETLIGCFINTLVLRGDLSGNPSLREVIRKTREAALGAYTNQELPFEKLVEELRPERSLSRSPLFQVMFVIQDESQPELTLPGIEVSPLAVETTTSKFDLSLGVVEKAQGLEVWLTYSADLFEPGSITCMLEDFKLVLESIVSNPEQHFSELPPLSWRPQLEPSQKSFEVAQPNGRLQKEFVAPRTPIEERLAEIWSEVLSLERVGVYDNFFELGGHSLLAARVISRARNAFAAELPLRRMFETPTVAGLAEAIYEIQTAETGDEELAAILAELSQLSEEEAQRQFAEEL